MVRYYSDKERIRLSSSVDEATGCWIWNKRLNSGGYGQLTYSIGGIRKTRSAHRLSYEAYNGPIPDGLCVCHKCDTPSCVNPKHLFIGTTQDNVTDKMNKGRGVFHGGEAHFTRRMKKAGLRLPVSKLSVEQIEYIIKNGVKGKSGNVMELANKFGVSRLTILNYINGVFK